MKVEPHASEFLETISKFKKRKINNFIDSLLSFSIKLKVNIFIFTSETYIDGEEMYKEM